MAIKRKRHSAETKRRVALEALKQQKTMNEITSEYGVHSSQISSWKKQALIDGDRGYFCQQRSAYDCRSAIGAR